MPPSLPTFVSFNWAIAANRTPRRTNQADNGDQGAATHRSIPPR